MTLSRAGQTERNNSNKLFMRTKNKIIMSALREEAEKIVTRQPLKKLVIDSHKKDASHLLHELQVYQAELEMQNDELKLSQLALEKERARFENLFNLAPVGYFIVNDLALLEECNENGRRMFGLKAGQEIKKRFNSLVAYDESESFYAFIRKLQLATEPVSSVTLKFVSLTGKTFYGDIYGGVVTCENSARLFYLAIVDVTERVVNAQKEHEARERLQLALHASRAGTWKINIKTGLIELDKFASEIFGFQGNFDGKFSTLFQNVHPEDRTLFDNALRESIISGSNFNLEFRIVKDEDRAFHVESHGHVISIEKENDYFVGLLRDITKRKILEEETHKLRSDQQKKVLNAIIVAQEEERLRISNALHDSVGQLLYGTSLKLQQAPLVPGSPNAEALQLLNQAIRETRKISFELAPSILTDFGLPVAVTEMISKVFPNQIKTAFHCVGFEKRLALPAETFLFRILQELLNNIIKHASATKVSILLEKNDDCINVKVTDNGVGISKSKSARSGTGLYSIKNRIALYSGKMSVSGRKNKGTSIKIILFNIN
jgi:PAS domain S-box-containing protein